MTTELQTVNRMLSAAGLAPVADANTQHPSYKKALLKLQDVSQTVQSSGYWFNTTEEITLQAANDGNVYIPQKAVHVNTLDADDKHIVMRGPIMYDLENRTQNIARDLRVKMVEVLDYNLLPMPVADYIAARAVLEFFIDSGGQEPKLTSYTRLFKEAEVLFKREVLKNHRPIQPSFRRTRTWDKIRAQFVEG